jgi:hypothetical protein
MNTAAAAVPAIAPGVIASVGGIIRSGFNPQGAGIP